MYVCVHTHPTRSRWVLEYIDIHLIYTYMRMYVYTYVCIYIHIDTSGYFLELQVGCFQGLQSCLIFQGCLIVAGHFIQTFTAVGVGVGVWRGRRVSRRRRGCQGERGGEGGAEREGEQCRGGEEANTVQNVCTHIYIMYVQFVFVLQAANTHTYPCLYICIIRTYECVYVCVCM